MPTYEYRCPECGVFEFKQAITEDPIEKCPECGSPVNRLISKNVGIVYKASGFYTTDNRPSSEKDKTETKAAEGKSEAKSEDKKSSEKKSESAKEASA